MFRDPRKNVSKFVAFHPYLFFCLNWNSKGQTHLRFQETSIKWSLFRSDIFPVKIPTYIAPIGCCYGF